MSYNGYIQLTVYLSRTPTDNLNMTKLTDKYAIKKKQECTYIKVCYLAEGLNCFGFKMDCPLYQKSNGEYLSMANFHKSVDELIDKTKAKHMGLL